MPSTYWCHRCNSFVRVWNPESVDCPDCNTGFIEEIEIPTPSSLSGSRRHRFPAAAMYMMRTSEPCPISGSSSRLRRSRRNWGDRSPFNPVIVLRGPNDGGGGFELYYDDGARSGLRPLPTTMSEFLLGSGFDRLLDRLSQIERLGLGRIDNNPPASKTAIDSMPTIEIIDDHISMESHCAVCKEAFELGNEARQMPCKHLYHPDCILPWLSLRNSCPVCRHELMSDNDNGGCSNEVGGDDETVGMTIWRLPGGVLAVGRFLGGRRGGEREFPLVYTEMDGGFNNNGNGMPRRVSWGNVSRNRGGLGLGRLFNGLFSCFGRAGAGAGAGASRRSGALSSAFNDVLTR